jgi:hypothetical protein
VEPDQHHGDGMQDAEQELGDFLPRHRASFRPGRFSLTSTAA